MLEHYLLDLINFRLEGGKGDGLLLLAFDANVFSDLHGVLLGSLVDGSVVLGLHLDAGHAIVVLQGVIVVGFAVIGLDRVGLLERQVIHIVGNHIG